MYRTLIVISVLCLFVMILGYDQRTDSTDSSTQGLTKIGVPKSTTTETELTSSEHINPSNTKTQSALVAYVSPETGQLINQPVSSNQKITANLQSSNLSQGSKDSQLAEKRPPIKFTTYPDGMVRAQLNGHFMVPQIATINCNGELVTTHSDQHEANTHCPGQ